MQTKVQEGIRWVIMETAGRLLDGQGNRVSEPSKRDAKKGEKKSRLRREAEYDGSQKSPAIQKQQPCQYSVYMDGWVGSCMHA